MASSKPINIEKFDEIYTDNLAYIYRYFIKNEYVYGVTSISPIDFMCLLDEKGVYNVTIEIYPLGTPNEDFANISDFPCECHIYLSPELYKLYTDGDSPFWNWNHPYTESDLPITKAISSFGTDESIPLLNKSVSCILVDPDGNICKRWGK